MAFPVRSPRRSARAKSALYLGVALPAFAFLTTLTNLGARAAAPKPKPKHTWEARHNLRAPRLKAGKSTKQKLAAGELLALELVDGQDWDRDRDTGWEAKNDVHPTHWSDNGAGGQFGYLGAGGQFLIASDPQRVTHYRGPAEAKTKIRISVTVDDEPRAVDPADGEVLNTFDDAPTTAFLTIGIASANHTHDWEVYTPLNTPSFPVETLTPVSGQIISVSIGSSENVEQDRCEGANPSECSFYSYDPNYPYGYASNYCYATSWSDGTATGDFGRYVSGVFTVESNPRLVTHYRCPVASGGQQVTLTLTTDDDTQVAEPGGGFINTADDAPATATRVLTFGSSHTHTWQVSQSILTPTVAVNNGGSGPFLSEQIIPIEHTRVGTELDVCLAAGCSFPGGMLNELTRLQSWSQNSSGQFGKMNGTQFVATNVWSEVTHYKCPTVTSGSQSVTLTATVDDPHDAGATGAFFNDNSNLGNKSFTVNAAPVHVHQWQVAHNVAFPSISIDPGQQRSGRLVTVSASVSSPEPDHCTAANCPFPGGNATNATRITAWIDSGTGGQFGYLNGSNVFVPSSDPALITRYKCPPVTGMTPVTVTLQVNADDQFQSIQMPNGQATDTFNDSGAAATTTLTVLPAHVHSWTSTGNLADQGCVLGNPAVSQAPRGLALPVQKLALMPADQDTCVNSDCSFPNGIATEILAQHTTKRWRDDTGGQFGKMVNGEFQSLPNTEVAQITHFLVGTAKAVGEQGNIWLEVDDAAAAIDPDTGGSVSTYNDDVKEGAKYSFTITNAKLVQTERKTDFCGCHCRNGRAEFKSVLNTVTGGVEFQVPVTSWNYRGTQLSLELAHDSNTMADPGLQSAGIPITPELARLSQRNSRWTHNWAQFVEVVDGGRVLWHTGSGGALEFLPQGVDPQNPSRFLWKPNDSYHSMWSTGTSTAWIKVAYEPTPGAAQTDAWQQIVLPYGQFHATDGAGTQYHFTTVYQERGLGAINPYFLLYQTVDRWGRTVTLNWTNGFLDSVIDGAGNGLAFSYNQGRLVSVTDSKTRVHNFGYSAVTDVLGVASQKLTSVQVEGPAGTRYNWSFTYGDPQAGGDVLSSKTQPNGLTVYYGYYPVSPSRATANDWDGRAATTTWNPGDGNRTITVNGGTVTYPEGNAVQYLYDGNRDLVEIRDVWTNRSVYYTYTQDGLHNLTSVRTSAEPAGQYLTKIDYTYGADNRTIVKTVTTNWTNDTPGDPNWKSKTETTYGTYNQPLLQTAYAKPGGQPYNQVTRWIYDNTSAMKLAFLRQGTLTDYLETALNYTQTGAPNTPSEVVDPLGRNWKSYFDGEGKPTSSESPENLSVAVGHVDRLPSTSGIVYYTSGTSEGLPYLVTDAGGRQVEFSYAAVGTNSQYLVVTAKELSQTPNPTTVVTLNADGQAIQIRDARNYTRSVQYDLDGRPTQVAEATNTLYGRITKYQYDLNGNLKKLIPPKGDLYSVQFEYRRYNQQRVLEGVYEGQVTRIQHPDGTQEFFGYDAQSGAKAWSLEGGANHSRLIQYTYDALHRPYQVIYPASPHGVGGFTTETQYDEFGRVKSVSDQTGTTSYAYDALDRPTQIIPNQSLPGGNRKTATISYGYDAATKAWKTRTQLAGVANYWETLEDTKGRPYQITNPLNQLFFTDYYRDGQIKTQTFPNLAQNEYQYNSRGLLGQLTTRKANQTVLDQFTYTYDVEGRVLTETDAGSRVHIFRYDPLGRLASEDHPDLGTGIDYNYDAHDNRTSVVENGVTEWYSHDLADKLQWTNTASNTAPTAGQNKVYTRLGYDDFGQLEWRDKRKTNGGTRRQYDFLWDTAGRLREVKEGANSRLSALYTADGERVQKTDDTSGGHIFSFGLHDTADNGTLYTPGLAQRRGANAANDRFFHSDWLGSTRYLTNNTGNQAPSALRYDAYGKRTAAVGPDDPTDYQFAGAWGYETEAHNGLGLQYLYQRYYDPETGSFLSRDPIRWAGGTNLYGYAGNDPVNGVDPTGTSFLSFAIKMGAKRASVGMLKNFIKTQVKEKLARVTLRSIARDLLQHADEIEGIFNDPWWVTAIGFIPIAGDAFELVHVPLQIKRAIDRASCLQESAEKLLRFQGSRAGRELIAIGGQAAVAGGRQGSMLLRRMAKRAGLALESGGEHLIVRNKAGNTVATIPHTLHGAQTAESIVEKILREAAGVPGIR